MIPIRLWSVVVSHDVQPPGFSLIPCAITSGRAACGFATPGAAISGVVKVGRFPSSSRRGLAFLARLPRQPQQRLRLLQVGCLLRQPLLVLVRRHRDYARGHVGVVLAAELGAVAEVLTGL